PRSGYAVATDQIPRDLADHSPIQDRAAGDPAVPIGLEDAVLGDAEAGRHACAEPILGNVRDSGGDRSARIAGAGATGADADEAARGEAHPRDRLCQLALPVAGHPGDTDDLPVPDGERHVADRLFATVPAHGEPFDVEGRALAGGHQALDSLRELD